MCVSVRVRVCVCVCVCACAREIWHDLVKFVNLLGSGKIYVDLVGFALFSKTRDGAGRETE